MNKRINYILTGLVVLFTVFSSCKKDEAETGPLTAEEHLNVSYGSNSRHTLDIYLPENRTKNTPVILLVHGGSWFEGDKSSFTDLAKYWRDRGYAAATMNYRLTRTSENNIHPAQVTDIGKAIDFIGLKANSWSIGANKFALLGASAGGHLSLLYTYKFNSNNKVKAVISLAGPTDLTGFEKASPLQAQVVSWLIGSSYQANPSAYAEASPITHVSSNPKPTLLFHGKLDKTVPYEQSVELEKRLAQYNVPRKLVLFDDTGHEVVNTNHTSTFLANTESWFKLYLR